MARCDRLEVKCNMRGIRTNGSFFFFFFLGEIDFVSSGIGKSSEKKKIIYCRQFVRPTKFKIFFLFSSWGAKSKTSVGGKRGGWEIIVIDGPMMTQVK